MCRCAVLACTMTCTKKHCSSCGTPTVTNNKNIEPKNVRFKNAMILPTHHQQVSLAQLKQRQRTFFVSLVVCDSGV